MNCSAPVLPVPVVDLCVPDSQSPTGMSLACGSYRLTYQLTVAGLYNLTATLNNTLLRDHPDPLRIKPSTISLATTYAFGRGTSQAYSGEGGNFTVVAVDQYTNRLTTGGSTVTGTVSGPRYIPVLTSTDMTDGRYYFAYDVDLVGDHSIQVKLGLEQFAFSPISPVSILPGQTVAANCVAMGLGLNESEVGYTSAFVIQPRDLFNNTKYDPNLDIFTARLYHPLQNRTVLQAADGVDLGLTTGETGGTAGIDLNGDADYTDIVVGAYAAKDGATNTGAAYVLFGQGE